MFYTESSLMEADCTIRLGIGGHTSEGFSQPFMGFYLVQWRMQSIRKDKSYLKILWILRRYGYM